MGAPRINRRRNTKLDPVTPDQAKQFIDVIDKACLEFSGTADELESAIGMYMIGRHYGWKVLLLVHNKNTIRKYEKILGIDVRKQFNETGPLSEFSRGYQIVQTLGNFWKAVSGDVKLGEDRRKLEPE